MGAAIGFMGADGQGRTVSAVDPLPVDNAGGSLTVDGKTYHSTVSFTRPANTTSYTAGDVIGSATSAIHTLSAAGPSGGSVLVQSMELFIGNTALPAGMGGFRVHLFSTSPTAIADNAVFNLISADRPHYRGYVDLGTPQDLGDTLFAQADYIGRLVKLAAASTSLFAEIEPRGGHTPVSGTAYELRMSTLETGL
jgi:hypothetical protein